MTIREPLMAYQCHHSRSLEISVAVSIVALAVIVVGGAGVLAWKVVR